MKIKHLYAVHIDKNQSPYGGWLFFVALLISTICVIVPFLPYMPEDGLDPSWMFGMNQSIAQKLAIGRDIIFTFGPYASVYTKSFHPATDGIMLMGGGVLGIAYGIALFLNFQRSDWCVRVGLLIVLAGLSYSRDALLFYYPLLVGAYIFKLAVFSSEAALKTTKGYALLVVLFIPFGLLPLIKGSFVVACLVVSILSFLLLGIKRDWKGGAFIWATPLISLIFFWCASGQSAKDLPSYFRSIIPIISGYTEAMAITGNSWDVYLYIAGVIFLLSSIIIGINARVEKKVALAFMFLTILFMGFKGGFVRHDGHAVMASSLLLLAVLLVYSFDRKNSLKITIVFTAFIWLFIDSNSFKTNSQAFLGNIVSTYRDAWVGVNSRIFDKEKLVHAYNNKLADLRARSNFPLLDGTTDIYSYDQSYLIASGNRWNPRPIFQSYSAYTPTLLEKNLAHLLGANKPDNLILRVQPIDDRVPSLEDGASWPAMLAGYQPTALSNSFLFLKRRPLIINIYKSVISEERHVFGEIVGIPPAKGLIFVKINIEPSVLGKAVNILFKPSKLFININMLNGATKRYRIISGMTGTGFLLSPLVETTSEFGLLYVGGAYLENKVVKSISINAEDGGGLWDKEYGIEFIAYDVPSDPEFIGQYGFSKPELQDSNLKFVVTEKCEGNIDTINNISPAPSNSKMISLLEVSGWLATSTGKGLLPESVYLTLSGREGTYFVKTKHTIRPDVGAYFKNNRLDASGYTTTVDVSKLVGHYEVGLAYNENGLLKLCPKFNIHAEINSGDKLFKK